MMPWRPTRHWLAVALFISIAFNILAAGMIAGEVAGPALWRRPNRYAQQFGPIAGNIIHHLAKGLDPAGRSAFLGELSSHAGELKQLNNSLRQQHRAIIALLRAESLDSAAISKGFAELQRRNLALQIALEAAITQAAEKVPAASRAHLEK